MIIMSIAAWLGLLIVLGICFGIWYLNVMFTILMDKRYNIRYKNEILH